MLAAIHKKMERNYSIRRNFLIDTWKLCWRHQTVSNNEHYWKTGATGYSIHFRKKTRNFLAIWSNILIFNLNFNIMLMFKKEKTSK